MLLAALPGRSWGQLLLVLFLYAAYALAVLLAPLARSSGARPPVPTGGADSSSG